MEKNKKMPELIIHKSQDTLNSIKNIIQKEQSGAYLRFGDGDFFLANNQNDKLQYATTNIATEMRQTISINGPHILKSIPLYCDKYKMNEPGMFSGNHLISNQFADQLLSIATKYWGQPITDVYSHAALHYTAIHDVPTCISFLHFLKKTKNKLLIGNENVPDDILRLLFENYKYIPTPDKNAYEQINEIENTFKNLIDNSTYTVVITFMGCSGRILQKRIWNSYKNVFLYDFGSLMDGLCGWKTRGWIKLTNFNSNSILTKI